MVNQSLRRMVERAYNVKAFQVVAPDWLDGVRFDVTTKYPEDTKNSDRPAMLRTLLEERFKLATHNETKELPAYALTVAKGGLKIKAVEATRTAGTSSNSNNNAVKLQVTAIPMTDVADYLARRLGSAVVDKTGVEGCTASNCIGPWTIRMAARAGERPSSLPFRKRSARSGSICKVPRHRCKSWWWIT